MRDREGINMQLFMKDVPSFVKNEVEQLQKRLLPLTKKVSKYMFWTMPLITISIFNLFVLLFIAPKSEHFITSIIIYAAAGAFGMALLKESKIQRKEIQRQSVSYIIERIKKSERASDHSKETYISLIQKQPLIAMNHFINFLMEEENPANRIY